MVPSSETRQPATADVDATSSSSPDTGADAAHRSERYFRRLVGTDVDQALAFFGNDYDFRAPRVRRTRPRAHWDFAGVGDDRMSLRSSRFLVDLQTDSHTDDEFLVAWIRGGTSTLTHAGESHDLVPGVPVILPFAETFELHHRDIAMNMVHLDRDFVRSIAGEDDFTFEALRRPSAEGMRVWQSVVRGYSGTWLDVDHELSPAAQRDIAEAFATAAITAFPERRHWRSTVTGGGPEHERLRRALEYVHEHAREPIGTPEIAAAAGLSPRGLQQSLRRHLDQTPGELLRGVRLDGARADLMRGDRDETSVADVARAWGFGHLGRFSATYRARFGELPSESLRSR